MADMGCLVRSIWPLRRVPLTPGLHASLAHLDRPTSLAGFAKGGATCSNLLTYRSYPPIMEWQLPTYLNETYNGTLALDAQETIYTIWIGTNDLGVNALLTGSDAPDVSIVSVRQCAVDVLKRLYESGARNFIMQNVRRKPVESRPKCQCSRPLRGRSSRST